MWTLITVKLCVSTVLSRFLNDLNQCFLDFSVIKSFGNVVERDFDSLGLGVGAGAGVADILYF